MEPQLWLGSDTQVPQVPVKVANFFRLWHQVLQPMAKAMIPPEFWGMNTEFMLVIYEFMISHGFYQLFWLFWISIDFLDHIFSPFLRWGLRVRWPRPTRNTWLTFWLWPRRPDQIREDDFGLSFMIFIFWISRICNLDNHVIYIYHLISNVELSWNFQDPELSLISWDDNPSYIPISPMIFPWYHRVGTAWGGHRARLRRGGEQGAVRLGRAGGDALEDAGAWGWGFDDVWCYYHLVMSQ